MPNFISNSKLLPISLEDLADQKIEFKKLKRRLKLIKTAENYGFSKELILELIADSDCKGIEVHLHLDAERLVHVYLEPRYDGGIGPIPGPGVGHSPNE